MKVNPFFSALLLLGLETTRAQETNQVPLYVGNLPGGKGVELKWLFTYRFETPVNVYRKTPTETRWQKLNAAPLRATAPGTDTQPDALGRYNAARSRVPNEWQALALYARMVSLDALRDNEFARYAGMYFRDATAQAGQTYQYLATMTLEGKEQIFASSKSVVVQPFKPQAAPLGLTARQDKPLKIALKWIYDRNHALYHVFRRAGNGPEQRLTEQALLVPEFVNGKAPTELYADADSAKKEGVAYTYRVASVDNFGNVGQLSAPVSFTLRDMTPPLAANQVKARLTEKKQVRVSWKPSPSADCKGYALYRSTSPQKPFQRLTPGLLARTDTVFVDVTATEGSGWYYYLAAEDGAGNISKSNAAQLVFADNTPPQIPTGLIVKTDTLGRVLLAWNPNAEPDLAGYFVYRGLEEQADNFEQLFLKPQQLTRFVDTLTRTARNKFFYRVTAADKAFNESAPASLTVRLPDVVPPRPPVLDELRAVGGRVFLTWFASASDDVAGYQVFRKTENALNAAYQFAGRATATRFEEATPPAGDYRYIVVSVDSAGLRSQPSADRLLRLDDGQTLQAPGAPTARFNPADRSLLVSWAATPQPADFAGYLVQLRRGEGSFQAASAYLTTTQTTLTRLGNDPDAEVRVVAVGVDGEQRPGPVVKVSLPKP